MTQSEKKSCLYPVCPLYFAKEADQERQTEILAQETDAAEPRRPYTEKGQMFSDQLHCHPE